MKVLELGAYDAILGYDWLKPHSPMNCHLENRTMEFEDEGRKILLKGVQPQKEVLEEVSVDKVVKWSQRNDIWAVAGLEALQEPTPQPESNDVQQLLESFTDVFQEPKTLPHYRFYDHTVPLIPGSTPVNSRPYKYSPQHKDEIEKQIKDMLAAGLIEQSASPFASPILLVLKKMAPSISLCIIED